MSCARKKAIVLTGVSQGLGHALVRAWASAGHMVYGCSRRKEALDVLERAFPDNFVGSAVDVADFGAVKSWSESVLERDPRIDLLCNNAGVAENLMRPWEIEATTFSNVMRINVDGVFHCIKAFVPAMVA